MLDLGVMIGASILSPVMSNRTLFPGLGTVSRFPTSLSSSTLEYNLTKIIKSNEWR